jgi:hypothetical protein
VTSTPRSGNTPPAAAPEFNQNLLPLRHPVAEPAPTRHKTSHATQNPRPTVHETFEASGLEFAEHHPAKSSSYHNTFVTNQ